MFPDECGGGAGGHPDTIPGEVWRVCIRTRDVGMIIWQVANVMNHMPEGNHKGAMDAISLLLCAWNRHPLMRKHASGAAPVVVGGAASNFVLGSVGGKHHAPETVCPDSKLKMSDYGFAISQGHGLDHNSTSGVIANKPNQQRTDSEPTEKATPKKKQKGSGKGNQEPRHQEQEEA